MKLWICRDKYGLWLSKTKPFFVDDMWTNNNGTMDRIDSDDLFQEITIENSPQEMELKLVSEIVGVAESPLKTFPRVNEFEVGASYRR